MEWIAHREYRLADPYIIATPDSGVRRQYAPLKEKRIVAQFAGIRDNKELLRFVRLYGLLREGGGDPLPWFWDHVRQVRLALELATLLQDGETTDEDTAYVVEAHGYAGGVLSLPFVTGDPSGGHPVEFRGEPAAVAREVVAEIVNENVGGVAYRLDPATLEPVEDVADLLSAIYVQLREVVAGGKLVRCADPKCRRVFVRTHKRAKYCPPTGGAKTSQCGDRLRKSLKGD